MSGMSANWNARVECLTSILGLCQVFRRVVMRAVGKTWDYRKHALSFIGNRKTKLA